MSSLVILGAGGFLGRALIAGGHFPMPVKAVARIIPSDADLSQEGVAWFTADLLTSTALDIVLEHGDVVINLAYMSDASEAKNVSLVDNIIKVCLSNRVARLLHCSTAVVAGATPVSRVVESTPCVPLTFYEKIKWALEQRVLSALPRGLDVGILRPTAIIGPGGQNLLKLVRSLQSGSRTVNYLRACLFGGRPMNLVPVRDVAAALLHLAVLPEALNGNVYIVSSDDDPENNFHSVEEILLRSMGMEPRMLPLLPLPIQLLSLLQKLLGRTDATMERIYDSKKLRATNLKPVDSVAKAVLEFGEKIQNYEK